MDVSTIAQMHVRLSAYLPRDLAQQVHPRAVMLALQTAWDNGWRDPEWLANYALEGTAHPSVRDAGAVFMARLQEGAETECPRIETPQPPRTITGPNAQTTSAATPDQVAAHVAAARAALGRSSGGEECPAPGREGTVDATNYTDVIPTTTRHSDAPTAPVADFDVDPWEAP